MPHWVTRLRGASRFWGRAAAALWVLAGPAAADAPTLPSVVSMNLCTDQLVLLLADPSQITSLSRLATDPRSSSLFKQAANYRQNAGGAEEIFLSGPDVVFAGRYSDKATLAMLRSMGLRVEQFPLTKSLDQIPDQIRTMGEILHQRARAERMAVDFESYLASVPPLDGTAPVAAFYYPNGYSLGVDTLGHDIVTTGGFRNLSEKLGRARSGRLALEQLVLEAPDVLITTRPYRGGSRSEEIMIHPAIAHYAQEERLVYSSSDWVCGTPITLRAVRDVARARTKFMFEDTKND